jgi:hypothetical protein
MVFATDDSVVGIVEGKQTMQADKTESHPTSPA